MTKGSMSNEQAFAMQPLALAFIGDAVFELYVREHVLERGYRTVNIMHREAIKYVSAGSQARAFGSIAPLLDERELEIIRRGRNAHPHTVPKNAEIADYRLATALEALFGYHWLCGNDARLDELVSVIFTHIDEGE